jgi:NitT/TauT family transport system substrate-binding protein
MDQASRWFLASLSVVVAVASAISGPASAQTKTLTFVQMHPVVGIGEEIFLYAVPKRLGYFAKEGLDVKLQGAPSGTVAAQVIQTNGAQIGTTAPESIMQLQEQGGTLEAIFGLKRNAGTFVVVLDNSPIKTLADLKGRTVAANSFGSGGGFSLRESLNELSVSQDQYVQVTMSPGPAAFAALQSGKIDALVLWDAMLGAAENSGMKLRRLSISFQDRLAGMSIAANGEFIKSNPEAVEGYCRAMTKALVFTKANPEAAVKLFWEEFPTAKPSTGTDEVNLQNATHILGRFLEMALQGQPDDAPLGAFIPDAWKNTYATFVKLGTIKGKGSAAEAYSSRFIHACNDFDKKAVIAEALQVK